MADILSFVYTIFWPSGAVNVEFTVRVLTLGVRSLPFRRIS